MKSKPTPAGNAAKLAMFRMKALNANAAAKKDAVAAEQAKHALKLARKAHKAARKLAKKSKRQARALDKVLRKISTKAGKTKPAKAARA
jgi:16S rRNA C1402 (ribose-2'-O) methylase RsmI